MLLKCAPCSMRTLLVTAQLKACSFHLVAGTDATLALYGAVHEGRSRESMNMFITRAQKGARREGRG